MFSIQPLFGGQYFMKLDHPKLFGTFSHNSGEAPLKLWELCSYRCDFRSSEGLAFAFAKDEDELGRLIWQVWRLNWILISILGVRAKESREIFIYDAYCALFHILHERAQPYRS